MRTVVLTGAGISAESGLATFRDAGGLWEGHHPEDVATPEAFAFNRSLVQRFYDARRASLLRVTPNPAHMALAALEERLGDDLFLITQNVDDLHERAGSQRVHHMHGELGKARCERCGIVQEWTGSLADEPDCPACHAPALRPDVVWFGEYPYWLDEIDAALDSCEVFVAIGTSGVVQPAAAFVHWASARGAATVELNLKPSFNGDFDEVRSGPASVVVPAWVTETLATLNGLSAGS